MEKQVLQVGPTRITRVAFAPRICEWPELLPHLSRGHNNRSEQLAIGDAEIYQPRHALIKAAIHEHVGIDTFSQCDVKRKCLS